MKIKISNCTNPESCLKCIQACPAYILVLKPIGTKKMSEYVKKWEIRAIFKDRCNGCMKCVEICPEQCIRIEF